MAFFHGSVVSKALGMSTGLTVSIPAEGWKYPDGFPVLYLLHGLSDNASNWARRSNIDLYAEEAGMVVIMPEVQRSFYCDMQYGPAYFTYVADELPALCAAMLHLSDRREDTFVAGLSMGGYGALKVALSRPDRFEAVASFSGALDMAGRFPAGLPEFMAVSGGELRDEDDLFLLAQKLSPEQRPRVYMTCGEQDFLLDESRRFSAKLDALGWNHTLETWKGDHEWRFWDASIQKALQFFRKT